MVYLLEEKVLFLGKKKLIKDKRRWSK